MSVYTKFEVDSSIRSKVIRRVPKFRNWVTWPRPRPFRVRVIFHTQAGYVLFVIKADCSIRSKVIKGVPKSGK